MKIVSFVIVAVCLLSIGCGSNGDKASPPPSTPTLTSLHITTASMTVPLGATQSLTATGTYSDGSTKDLSDRVTWASSASDIATVSHLGDITGLSRGAVTVTATSESLSDALNLTVGDPALARIDITPSAPTTPPNTSQQLVALGHYTDGTAREVNDLVSWTSSDTAKVTISGAGVATATATGSATVSASAGAISGSATMTVSAAQLVRIAVLPYQPVTGIGVTQRFVTLGTFDDYSTHELVSASWTSSQPTVATIGPDGLSSPILGGTATITASVGAITNSTVMTVLPATLSSIVVSPVSTSIASGTDQQFTASGILTDFSVVELPVVDWKSSNASIAAVDGDGRVIASAPGKANISAGMGGISGSRTVNVSSATLQSITIAPAVPAVPILSLKQLYAIGTFSDGTTQDITRIATWWTNNTDLVTVNHKGLTNTNAKGSARITASVGTVWGDADFQVSPLTVSSVAVEPNNFTLPKGAKLQYSLVSTLSDGSTRTLDAPRWFTSPITMATTTSGGLVTARTAAIGKMYGETCCKTAYTQLTVTNARAVSLAILIKDGSTPKGAMIPLTAEATFDDATVVDVSNAVQWTSSNPAVALVDGTGMLTAISDGSTSVTATFGPVDGAPDRISQTASITIAPASIVGLTISSNPAAVPLGGSLQLAAKGTFDDASQHLVPGLTWKSSDPKIAIVLPSGLVVSTGVGSAVITASVGSMEATTSITVQ